MFPEKKPDEKFSYADYLTWNDDERWELINGEAWSMSPAPRTEHQKVSGELFGNLWQYLKGKPCQVFSAPFDVRLVKDKQADDQDIFTTVQPDISVICDKSKIDDKGCLGAPDLIVEILSPSTGYKDETEKLTLYEEYGVREYWLINPDRKTIQIFLHNGREYDKPSYFKGDDVINSVVLKGFKISLKEIFQV